MLRLATAAVVCLACVAEGFSEPDDTGAGVRRDAGSQEIYVKTNGHISTGGSMERATETESRTFRDELGVRRQSRKHGETQGSLPSSLGSGGADRRLKVAMVFRGESFRAVNNPDHLGGRRAQYGAHKRRTCEDHSLNSQKELTDMHNEVLTKIVKLGIDVDTFGVTYACKNGMDYASRLSDMYVPKLKALDIIPKERSLQLTTLAHALRMAVKSGNTYDGIYLLRWDYMYTRILESMNKSACWVDSLPRDLDSFTSSNADSLIYVPGSHAEEMLRFMDLEASPCCGPPCVQGCSECIGNFMKHLGKTVKPNSCHPCAVADTCGDPRSLGEANNEPLDVDEVWCKGKK